MSKPHSQIGLVWFRQSLLSQFAHERKVRFNFNFQTGFDIGCVYENDLPGSPLPGRVQEHQRCVESCRSVDEFCRLRSFLANQPEGIRYEEGCVRWRRPLRARYRSVSIIIYRRQCLLCLNLIEIRNSAGATFNPPHSNCPLLCVLYIPRVQMDPLNSGNSSLLANNVA